MDKSLGQRIRELREKRQLSLRELAARVNVSAPFISDVELGRRYPSADTLKALADALNVTLVDLARHDHRPIVEAIRQRSTIDPAYGHLLGQLIERFPTSEDLRHLLESTE
jgi:transcriptional regulator with XRE-family HTH domain